MVDNFQKIESLISFNNNDQFYFLQILKRKKENPDVGRNSVCIKSYYIKSLEHFQKVKPEIIELCKFHNARAYMNLNKRSFERIAMHTFKKMTDIIMNKDYSHIHTAYDSACGEFTFDSHRTWILDIDEKNLNLSTDVAKSLWNLMPEGDKHIATLETKNGYHLIVKPFDVRGYMYPEITIQKNSPTLLYYHD